MTDTPNFAARITALENGLIDELRNLAPPLHPWQQAERIADTGAEAAIRTFLLQYEQDIRNVCAIARDYASREAAR